MLTPWLDYGALNFGEAGVNKTLSLVVENLSEGPARFSLCESGSAAPAFGARGSSESGATPKGLIFSENTGTLKAREKRTVKVTLYPRALGYLRSHLEVHVEHGSTQYAEVLCKVEAPEFEIPTVTRDLGTCYVGIPRTTSFVVRNKTYLSGTYQWEQQDYAEYRAEYSPGLGKLGQGGTPSRSQSCPRPRGRCACSLGVTSRALTNRSESKSRELYSLSMYQSTQ